MPPGRFDAFRDDESSDDDDKTNAVEQPPAAPKKNAAVPSYEDLSMSRADEETVLMVVYGDEFTREEGVWGCARLNVHCRPPDTDNVGCELTLSVQLAKQYPYVAPAMEFRNAKGLSPAETAELLALLQTRADELALSGSVMMIELVQVVEDFLVTHNRDPNMSAWEQMKAREAEEERERMELQRMEDEVLKNLLQNSTNTNNTEPESPGGRVLRFKTIGGEVEKELARQVEALKQAKVKRQSNSSVDSDDSDEDGGFGEGEDDDDDDDGPHPIVGSSRYATDFVELGLLGRGGGGEVVKVRNRLDRRIYAVKKIILESEAGKYAKFGAVQNQKLRREVTTISRMTHKNIVRYYQAWVEGDEDKTDTDVAQVEADEANKSRAIESESGSISSSSTSSSDNEESKGWWKSSPTMTSMPDQSTSDERGMLAEKSSSVNWDDSDESTSSSANQDIDLENDFHDPLAAGMSPLMAGMGFQNDYHGLFERRKISGTSTIEEKVDEEDIWDESSVKVDVSLGQRILYIQMEYCSTTLRKVIDEALVNPIEETEKWRMIRQIVEALAYIHGRKLIHRDLKPGNVFLDSEGNIRLGDFGLATEHNSKLQKRSDQADEVDCIYNAIEDISGLLGGSLQTTGVTEAPVSGREGLTGGVGTTFYRAPEQEGGKTTQKGERYNVQVDIFSLGIVVFEMFHPPFDTYMERAETLNRLRGDLATKSNDIHFNPQGPNSQWEKLAEQRFPTLFLESTPKSVQKLILWCLQKDPSKRPKADEILSNDLLPRKMELEQHYLEEALHTLANPQSESYLQILQALFERNTSDLVEVTFDTDFAAKANNLGTAGSKDRSRTVSPSEEIMKAISNIRSTGSLDIDSLRSVAMSASSLLSAAASLRRAKQAGKIGKGGKGMMKRCTQRVAGILAMQAATSAAVTGLADGVHGADPRVVDFVCDRLRSIFGAHGAVHLRSPLLRPKPSYEPSGSSGGPAEMMNSRGTVVLLPEDLTASFARAVGRGGAATSNIKRFDVGRVYHKSLVGGHPRENLEASFDIIHEDRSVDPINMEAEAILVLCHSISIIAPNKAAKIMTPAMDGSSLWYLRISHTRLTDAILEVCGVPAREPLRKHCLEMLTELTAPTPASVLLEISPPTRGRSMSFSDVSTGDNKRKIADTLDSRISKLIENGLPRTSAQRFHMFLSSGVSPLPANVEEAVDAVVRAVGNIRLLDSGTNVDPRRLKRYDDVGRSAKHLKQLIQVLDTLGVCAHHHGHTKTASSQNSSVSSPLYICLDLGLRQRRRHFSQLFFQGLLIPPSMFISAESTRPPGEFDVGVKVAEGGRYDDLVRRYRPPGNFGSALFTFYTNATIPICVGVRFVVGRFVESMYVESTLSLSTAAADMDANNKFISDAAGIEVLRKSLGHPLQASSSVQVIVASANGMDAASASERLVVASQLWSHGISAEYLTHSGVMLSLLQSRSHESTSSDWSLEELCGVCGILKIPYVVIVQPHLLRDKGSVRLRRIQFDGSNTNLAETFVAVGNLADAILAGEDDADHAGDISNDHDGDASMMLTGVQNSSSHRPLHTKSSSPVECVFVETDQFWGSEKQITKSDSPNWRSILKSLKSVSQRSEAYLDSIVGGGGKDSHHSSVVVVAAELPFWVLREFGTNLMRSCHEATATVASKETTERYPKYKRILKTFAMAIDATMRKFGYWSHNSSHLKAGLSSSSKNGLLTLFLYSKLDDRFDMISLGDDTKSPYVSSHQQREGNHDQQGRRRNDRRKG